MVRKCAFLGCNNTKVLFAFPRDARAQFWVQAAGLLWPTNTHKKYVCNKHFTPESFVNLGSVESGFAHRLVLNKDAVPIPVKPIVIVSTTLPVTREVGCQCNAPVLKSVAVQAVLTQKKPKRRSKAIQVKPLVSNCASVSCSDEDFPVKSESSFTLTPIKRPRMEDSSEGTSYSSEEPTDDTHVPDIIQEEDIKLEPCDSSYIVVTI
ncbi:uncharacterized protein [Chanodichthys erythropterus]|uniref:uncharacterized protein isoform X2 n=1 Tax=Chanodichthys erythropterus TaxID=933992 RepID=UPI00351F649E